MKNLKIYYWVSTIVFAGFMAFTAVPDVLKSEDAMKFIMALGYPDYFVPFIGVAKILGSLAICLPQLKKIKEWAYAGLFFDLIAAGYSILMVGGFNAGIFFIAAVILVGAASYYFNTKRQA
jgi:hypothetical protein